MKTQQLITETSRLSFQGKVNKALDEGAKIVPCTLTIALSSDIPNGKVLPEITERYAVAVEYTVEM